MESTSEAPIQRTKRFPVEHMCSALPDKDGITRRVPQYVDSEWLASALDQYDDRELAREAFNRTLDPSLGINVSAEEWSDLHVEIMHWQRLGNKLADMQSEITSARIKREEDLRIAAGDPVAIAERRIRNETPQEKKKRLKTESLGQ